MGTYNWADYRAKYMGHFVAGKRGGKGTLRYPNYSVQKEGRYNVQEKQLVYVEDWKEDKEHGYGIMRQKDDVFLVWAIKRMFGVKFVGENVAKP